MLRNLFASSAAGSMARALGLLAVLPILELENGGGGGGEAELKALAADLKKATDEVKKFAESAQNWLGSSRGASDRADQVTGMLRQAIVAGVPTAASARRSGR